ncbi:MAG: hypothetical protein E3J71_08860 [Candidatus Stahlbacteria bacterium]|nr:MAG: hypothetical protein E3J71_08860 [Candidatus Stahlbacteria bacterium]
MAKDQPKFLAVLPWLRVRGEIDIGPFVFWQWPWNEKKYVPSAHTDRVKETLNAHFMEVQWDAPNKGWTIAPRTSLCLAGWRNRALEESLWFTKEDFELFRPAGDILCASSLFKTLLRRDSINAENPSVQELFYKNATDFAWYGIHLDAEAGSRQIRRRYGSILRGEFPPIPRVKPDECTDQEVIGKDGLATSLGKMLESSPTDFSRRTFRAIEQFNNAFTDSMVIIHHTEIVMLGTAFEILLKIYNVYSEKKKQELGKRISKLFSRNTVIPEPTTNKSWEVFWIESFYGLRNDIVHGKRIPFKNLEWPNNPYAGLHQEIAIHVFRLALMKTLVEKQLHVETDEDIWQANKLDEWLSTEMKRFPSASDTDFALWSVAKELKAKDDA